MSPLLLFCVLALCRANGFSLVSASEWSNIPVAQSTELLQQCEGLLTWQTADLADHSYDETGPLTWQAADVADHSWTYLSINDPDDKLTPENGVPSSSHR